jgi:hypothetical protein
MQCCGTAYTTVSYAEATFSETLLHNEINEALSHTVLYLSVYRYGGRGRSMHGLRAREERKPSAGPRGEAPTAN